MIAGRRVDSVPDDIVRLNEKVEIRMGGGKRRIIARKTGSRGEGGVSTQCWTTCRPAQHCVHERESHMQTGS